MTIKKAPNFLEILEATPLNQLNQICLFMQPGEKEAEGGLYCSLQLSKSRLLAPCKTRKKTNIVLVYSKCFPKIE